MWIGTTLLSDLKAEGKWKVEAFSEHGNGKAEAAFDFARVGDVVSRRGEGLTPKEYPDHVFNYLGLGNVESLTGDLVDFKPQLGAEVRSRSKIFREGDVLYGKLRPYLNKVYLAEEPVYEGVCSSEFYVLVPKSDLVMPRYLRAILASEYVSQKVESLQTGSTHPRLQREDLMDFQIPLPPLPFQKEIVDFIQAHNERRRKLMREVEKLPSAINDAVVNSLELGGNPELRLVRQNETAYDNPLPRKFS